MAESKAMSRASSKKSGKKPAAEASKPKAKKAAAKVVREEPATETTAAPDGDTDAEMSDVASILSVVIESTLTKEKKKLEELLATEEDLDCIAFIVYPKACTPGCTKQVNAFNSKIEEFRQLGVQLVGLSQDKLEGQKKFVESEDLDFPLIAGGDNKLLTMLKCLAGGKVVRSVVAVDSLGNIFYEKHKVKPEESCGDLLKFLRDRKEAEQQSESKPEEEKLKKTRSSKKGASETLVKKAPATKKAGKAETKKKSGSTRSSTRLAKA